MVQLIFEQFSLDQAEMLIEWLSTDTWPYHVAAHPDPAKVRTRIEAGDYT